MQVIALMAFLLEKRRVDHPFLIAAPAAVVDNWDKELRRWVPGLSWIVYKGAAEARATLFRSQACPLIFPWRQCAKSFHGLTIRPFPFSSTPGAERLSSCW